MRLRLVMVIIFMVSCSLPGTKPITNDSGFNLDLNRDISSKEQVFKLNELKDTTLNGVILDFTVLPETRYDSLRQLVRESFIPLQFNTDKILRMDSCLLVKLDTETRDTLCNKRQGDYFEQYTFKGFWNEVGLVLITYQDWEGGNDFFINMKDGEYYYLTHNYKVSPDFKHILSFVDLNETVFIPSGLLLTDCGHQFISTRLYIEFDSVIITSLSWLNNEQCLISAGTLDNSNFSVRDVRNYALSLTYN